MGERLKEEEWKIERIEDESRLCRVPRSEIIKEF
jgi:hypothetical protein